jgi:outer membrane protein assembly factor BamB
MERPQSKSAFGVDPVHITAVCPACRSSYQLQPSLRGQTIRCPNPRCRAPFAVPAEEPPAPTSEQSASRPEGNGPRSGSVSDLVPVLEAEAVEELPLAEEIPAQPPDAPPWQQTPPGRHRPGRAAQTVADMSPADAPEGARVLGPGAWEPPRGRGGPAAAVEAPSEAVEQVEYVPPRPARRLGLLVLGFALLVVAALGVGGFFTVRALWVTESALAAQADGDYQAGRFTKAAETYKQLATRFPASSKAESYRLMQALAELRNDMNAPDVPTSSLLDRLDSFLADNRDKQAVRSHAVDLGESLARLAESQPERFPAPLADPEAPLKIAERLDQCRDKLRAANSEAPTTEQAGRIQKAGDKLRDVVAVRRRQDAAVARVLGAPVKARTPSEAVVAFRRGLKREVVAWPEVVQNSEILQLREKLYAAQLAGVSYARVAADLGKPPFHPNDVPTIVIDPLLDGPPGKAPKDDPIVLALSRGLLYALRQSNGQAKWVTRVGVDSAALPVIVPAEDASPQRILVLSADAGTLSALDDDGVEQWAYRLGQPCLGRPLVIDRRAFVPTYDGRVHEIELTGGKLQGIYDLGQPLTVGGVYQKATGLIYFPADEGCVYVLDADNGRCTTILYTDHPAGSLRSEPLIAAPQPNDPEGWLVLNQTDGLDAVRPRVYQLPIADPETPPIEFKDPPRVRGWTWFSPYFDTEKVVMVGDAGDLGLFDVRQPGNPRDPALFPRVPGGIDLTPFFGPPSKSRSRAELVQAAGEDFWVAAHGKLDRVRVRLDARAGFTTSAVWPAPLALGSPLHQSQVVEDPRGGRSTLFLVTRPLDRQVTLATAVDDEDGRVLWQRQLGLVCRGEPLPLRPGGVGPALLLALDQGGGLVLFDPRPPAARRGAVGVGAGVGALAMGATVRGEDVWRSLFPALDDGPDLPPLLIAGPDGASAYEIACTGDGRRLVVRQVIADADGVHGREAVLPLAAPLAGRPALGGGLLLLPLADGAVARLPLPLEEAPQVQGKGPTWRLKSEGPVAAERHVAVAPLGGYAFLATDGARNLSHFLWKADGAISSLPEGGKQRPAPEFKDRLDGDLLVLPEKDGVRRVCTADGAGEISVWNVAEGGKLTPRHKPWRPGGRVTAGPFLRGAADGDVRIGCVLDRRRLAWIDPELDQVLWVYPDKADTEIVGRPEVVGDLVVVADQAGRIVGLDPETGKPVGTGYQLQGSVTAAASPVAYGPDRLFVPLTDGAVLLPEVSRLRRGEDKAPAQ